MADPVETDYDRFNGTRWWRRWWRRNVVADDPMDDEQLRWASDRVYDQDAEDDGPPSA